MTPIPMGTELSSSGIGDVVQEWYANYIDIDFPSVIELIWAADTIQAEGLYQLAVAKGATFLRGRTVEEANAFLQQFAS